MKLQLKKLAPVAIALFLLFSSTNSQSGELGRTSVVFGGGTLVTISGNIMANGAFVAGADVVVSNSQFIVNSVLTDGNGDYSVEVVAGNTYTVGVYKNGYNFDPAYQTFSDVQTDRSANFQNGTVLCIPAPAGQSGSGYCENAAATSASTIQNGKIAYERSGYTFVMDPDGSNQIQIPQGGHFPAWSPDGNFIAFNRIPVFESDEELYIMNADGSHVRIITANNTADIQPRWSPDGTQLVYNCFVDFNNEICKINTDGTGPVRLTNNEASDRFPSFSPDGLKIVFVSDRVNGGGTGDIFVMNADGTGQTRLTFDDEFTLSDYPAWSPDGTKIIFRSNPGDGYVDLWRMNADGSGLTQITNDTNFNETQPTYSPDGAKIAFGREANVGELNDIFTINASNGDDPVALTNTASQNESYPSWQAIRSSVGVSTVGGVFLTFSNVTNGGSTVATSIAPTSAGALPSGFRLIPESVAYDVRSSAGHSGSIEVCFNVSNVDDQGLFDSLAVFHNESGVLFDRTSSHDFTARKICANVNSLSPFVVAAPAAPTAAEVTVSGRVVTTDGRGLVNATVLLTDPFGKTLTARTTSFGYYSFDGVNAGETYILEARSKSYQFSPRVVKVDDDLFELDFIALH
ncbi:MAG: carboxypeptidase regulatory-like domain-containing protein [Acidobacteriota bacterium]